jgi:hypothetical protein
VVLEVLGQLEFLEVQVTRADREIVAEVVFKEEPEVLDPKVETDDPVPQDILVHLVLQDL